LPAVFGTDADKTAVFLIVRGEVVFIAGIEYNLFPLVDRGDGVDVFEVLPGDDADGLLNLLFGDAILSGIGERVITLIRGEVDGILANLQA